MSAEDHKKPPQVWMRNLLLASAGLNIFLAGFIFAKVLAPEVENKPVERTKIELASLPKDLPPHIREEVEDQFRTHRKDMERDYEKLVEARVRVRDLLDDENLDEEALRAALDEMNGLQIEIQGTIQNALFQAMLQMDPEVRRVFFLKGEDGAERGIWTQRNFDGARWKVEIENGNIVLDLQGITDKDKDEDLDEGSE